MLQNHVSINCATYLLIDLTIFSHFIGRMTTLTSIVSLLAIRISKWTDFPFNEQSTERELVEHLYTTIQNFILCSLYTIENDVVLDYDDRFDDSSNNAPENSEIDEEIDATFSEDQNDKSILKYFSLDYMEKILDYYEQVDGEGN